MDQELPLGFVQHHVKMHFIQREHKAPS